MNEIKYLLSSWSVFCNITAYIDTAQILNCKPDLDKVV